VDRRTETYAQTDTQTDTDKNNTQLLHTTLITIDTVSETQLSASHR